MVLRFVLRRLLTMVPMLLGITLITFILTNLIPGDPARLALGVNAADETVAALRREMGLDEPLYSQYLLYMQNLLSGDWGRSITTGRPVLAELKTHYPATFELTLVALCLALVLGVGLGVWSATRANRLPDHFVRLVSVVGVSAPVFWLALILMYLFYIRFPFIEGFGRINPDLVQGGAVPIRTGLYLIDTLWAGQLRALASALNHLILPAVCLSLATLTRVVRMTRAGLLEVLAEEYVRAARSKGLAEAVVIYKHALRNAMIPVLTVLGVSFGYMLAGAVLVETIFAWPGMGRLVYEAVLHLDYPVVIGVTLIASMSLLFVNLLTDLAYFWLDPRLRH